MTFYQLVDAMEKVMTEQQELLKRAEDRLKDMTEEYSQCLTRIADLEAGNRRGKQLERQKPGEGMARRMG